MFIPNTDKAFTYDFALPGDASNEQTYDQAVAGMIPRLFEVRLTFVFIPSNLLNGLKMIFIKS